MGQKWRVPTSSEPILKTECQKPAWLLHCCGATPQSDAYSPETQDTHHHHIQYHQFKAMGLPISSGMVESACKWLILQRFKGVGMRWSEEGFNAQLHLRLAWVNQRFEALFSISPN